MTCEEVRCLKSILYIGGISHNRCFALSVFYSVKHQPEVSNTRRSTVDWSQGGVVSPRTVWSSGAAGQTDAFTVSPNKSTHTTREKEKHEQNLLEGW